MSEKDITKILTDIAKTADVAQNFDLALMLGVIAKARRQGKETELATFMARYAVDAGLTKTVHII